MQQNNEIVPAKSGAHNKIVETYAEDMAKVIENDQSGGLIKKIIHGEEEHEKEKRNLSPQSKKNKFFMLVGLLLFALGAATLIYFINSREVPTVPVEDQFIPLIFTDKSIFIEVKDLNKEKITQSVRTAVVSNDVKQGGVEGIYLTFDKKMIGLRQFISLLKANFVPGEIVFVSDNFLVGAVNENNNKDFFMLIKVRTTADVFDSMRLWESKMFSDLHGFFGVELSAETKYLLTKEFENSIIENKNARILYDKDNKIVMMYILADDNSVIITNTENATHELMLRLASSQIKK